MHVENHLNLVRITHRQEHQEDAVGEHENMEQSENVEDQSSGKSFWSSASVRLISPSSIILSGFAVIRLHSLNIC